MHTASFTSFEVLDVCQNLVVSNDAGIFRFAHLSVREFLLSEGQTQTRQDTCFSFEEGNAAIANACISYLSSTIQSGTTNVDDHLSISQQITKKPELRKYTANYWPLHVSQSGHFKSCPPLSSEIRSFLISDKDVAPTFANWCTIVTEELVNDALPNIQEAAQLPPNPIWLVHIYDIVEIKHVALDNRSMQCKAFLYAGGKGKQQSHVDTSGPRS